MHASMGRWQCIRRRQCKLTIGVHTCSSKQPAAAAGSRATNRAVSRANSRGPDKLMQLRREPGTPKPSMKALSKRTHRKARCCRCCVLVEKQTHSSHPKRNEPMDACVPARPLHRFINEAKLTHIACVTDLKKPMQASVLRTSDQCAPFNSRPREIALHAWLNAAVPRLCQDTGYELEVAARTMFCEGCDQS